MLITIHQKLYIAAALAALIVAVTAIHSIRSQMRVSRIERAAGELEHQAAKSEQKAAKATESAVRHSARAEHLEQQMDEIRALAVKQDEELKKLNSDTSNARGRAERSRGIRSIESNADELCQKLASLGHGC